MGKKGRNIFAWLLTPGFIFTFSSIVSAQVKGEKKASTMVRSAAPCSVEPLRAINGQMRGSTISGQFMLHNHPSDFSLVLSKAEIVGEKLQLVGVFRLGPDTRAFANVRARIAGTIAMLSIPGPGHQKMKPKAKPKANANDQQQGREAKNPEAAGQLGQLARSTQDTARKTPVAADERTEQTQSLDAQPEIAAGCGVLFLRMDLTQRLRIAMGKRTLCPNRSGACACG